MQEALTRAFGVERLQTVLNGDDAMALGQSRFAAVDLPATGDVEIGPRMSLAAIDTPASSADAL